MYKFAKYDVLYDGESAVVNDVFHTDFKMENPTKEQIAKSFGLDMGKIELDESNEDVIYVDYDGNPYGEFVEESKCGLWM